MQNPEVTSRHWRPSAGIPSLCEAIVAWFSCPMHTENPCKHNRCCQLQATQIMHNPCFMYAQVNTSRCVTADEGSSMAVNLLQQQDTLATPCLSCTLAQPSKSLHVHQ